MWNCLKCLNESADTAEYCAYCGSPRAASLENAREIAAKFSNPKTNDPRKSTLSSQAYYEFPVTVPAMLRLSEGTIRVVAAIIGVVAGFACSVMVYLFADPSSMS